MNEPEYTEFEKGERQALLQVRSFIATHGVKEVGDYAAQRLHDIKMNARAHAFARAAVAATGGGVEDPDWDRKVTVDPRPEQEEE